MSKLADRLREVRCDREPFTPDHAKCICRLANEAADEIERLDTELAGADVLIFRHQTAIDPNPRQTWPRMSLLEAACKRFEQRN